MVIAGTELGLTDPIRLSAPVSEIDLFVPVSPGLQPVALDMEVVATRNVMRGHLVFESEGRTLLSLVLPVEERRVTVPLGAVERGRDLLTVTVRAVLDSEEAACDAPLSQWVELRGLTIRMRGEPDPPATLAGFWPRPLRGLQLWVPEDFTPEVATAALQTAALALHRAAGAPVDLDIRFYREARPQVEAGEMGPFHRVVVLQQAESPRVRVRPLQGGAAVLVLEGPPEAMAGLARALTQVPWEVLPAADVSVTTHQAREQGDGGGRVTLEALGVSGWTLRGTGAMARDVYFSQEDLGGPVRRLRLRLGGRHSPIPKGGQAAVVVWLNDAVVGTTRLGEGARWEVTADISDSLLRRDNVLRLEVLYTSPAGGCRFGQDEIVFYLDPGSYLAFDPGQALPPGFGRFPQVFSEPLAVAIQPMDAAHLEAALRLVGALQRMARRPLVPQVSPLEEVLQAPGGLLVTSDVEVWERLDAPIQLVPFRLLDVGNVELMQIETDASFAVMAAVEARGADWILLGARGEPALVTRLAEEVSDGEGWFALHGDVVLLEASGARSVLRLRGSGLRAEPLPEVAVPWWPRLRPVLFGLTLLAAVLFLVWAYPRVVRPWRSPKE